MTPNRVWGYAGTGLAVATACAALAWRDCVLLATSLVLAHRLLLLRMDRGAPWRVLAAVHNALSTGVLTVGAGLVLVAGIATAWLGWWHPTAKHAAASLLLLLVGAAWCSLFRSNQEESLQELRPWLWLIVGSVVATEAHKTGVTFAPCLLVAAVAIAMIRAGWRLATETASALLRAGSELR